MPEFFSPYYLFLLMIVPFLIWYYEKRQKFLVQRMVMPSSLLFTGVRKTLKSTALRFWYLARVIVLVLLIMAIARPRSGTKHQDIKTEGIDIILVMDISTSMKAIDFKPINRLEAAKKIAIEFVNGRKSDRIGLVSFARESFTQCPLTIDYNMMINQIEALNFAPEEWNGTAIGNAIGTAVDRLKDSKSKSKVIILLTDGRNNSGEIDPKLAADLAKTFNIKIYTIGAGATGEVLYPTESIFGKDYTKVRIEIDDELLNEIAEKTGGQYFRATNTEGLRSIYKKISSMEKTKIEVKEFIKYKELFVSFAFPALLILIFSFLIENIWFKQIPK